MKLYHAPGASSLAAHITAREARIPLSLVKVDLKRHQTEDDANYLSINPRGYVPALQLDDGELLTEGILVLQFIADRAPEAALLPPAGTMDRYRAQQWLTFIATELHKQFFWAQPHLPADVTELARARISRRMLELDNRLGKHAYLTGEQYCVADAYLFTVLSWTGRFGIELKAYPNLQRFMTRVLERPATREALQHDGMLDSFVERYQ